MSFGYADCKSNKHGPGARTQVRGNSHILTYNNTQFVSFFVHRRQSRERFRMMCNKFHSLDSSHVS